VPLSEEEQRLLEQMEQALSTEDPKFASTLRGSAMRARSRRRAALAAAGFLAGVAILMTGAVVKMTVVAVIGFLAMLAAAYVFVSQWRRSTGAVEPVPSAPTQRAASRNRATAGSDSFMDRMEERWRKRRDETG
jgi:hypothetical protein